MWYKSRPMLRRGLSLTLLALLAVQLLGAVAFASVCLEPCPDETNSSSCPPICAACTTCTHSRPAIVQSQSDGAAFTTTPHLFPQEVAAATSAAAADIFHVPLHS